MKRIKNEKSSLKLAFVLVIIMVTVGTLIASCGNGGGGGGSSPPTAEGTLHSPVSLTLNSPHSGHVDTSTSFYSVAVTSGIQYTISITGATDPSVLPDVYSDAGFTLPLNYLLFGSGTSNVQCAPTAVGSTLYIAVIGMWTNAGATYTITVTPTPTPAAPANVAPVPGNTLATIYWPNVLGAASYNIYWSTTSGAGISGTRITGVISPYVHTGRTNGTPYYYVVTAVNAVGESAASSQVVVAPIAPTTTLPNANFDGGTLQGWYPSGTWGVTSAYSHSGVYSATDSPGGNYSSNSNTALTSPVIDLAGTTATSLSFFHRFDVESTFDYGYVEISTDGGLNFLPLVSYNGTLPTFTQDTIDLTPYTTSHNVVIRFRLTSDDVFNYDGWYIDDILFQ